MHKTGAFGKLCPLSLLTHASSYYDHVHLKVSSSSVSWSLYLKQGKITYASHSVAPRDRLDRHLRRLRNEIPIPVDKNHLQLQRSFQTNPEIQYPDYQAICWLVSHQYLNPAQAAVLIEELVKEVIESFLWIKAGTYELEEKFDAIPEFCRLALQPIIAHCQKRLQVWQSLGPHIWSPFQRPYIWGQTSSNQQPLLEIQQKISSVLKVGLSFYHLAVLLNQDELHLAQTLHPYIVDETILLHDPYSPFSQLPNIPAFTPESVTSTKQININFVTKTATVDTIADLQCNKRKYIIVGVDDNPTLLKKIQYFLQDESFSFFPISNPVKALIQILQLKPDLILIDIKMPEINGYELCRLLRNHAFFDNTPIIMIAENNGIIDRVKAWFVGASGYLTKPFTQTTLLKIMFKNLT